MSMLERNSENLMQHRIRKILLVCNNYDSFSLDEDGRIEAQIAREYADLNLTTPPTIKRVESTIEALALVKAGERFDLIITMYNVGQMSVFDFSHEVKSIMPETPIVLLTAFAKEIYRKIVSEDCSDIDHVFCWNNSTDLIVAIVKLLEDSMNAEHDIKDVGVQAILLVEDSIRYYSTYLPALYTIVLQQNSDSIRDTLNEQQQIFRKRSRPKILMATNYNDAVNLYNRYKSNILGVISDIGFVLNKGDKPESEKLDAGLDLCKLIRSDNPHMPFLLQSSQASMVAEAEKLKAGFILKNSKTLIHDLTEYIGREFGFGDFVVIDPETGEEISRAKDLYELEKLMKTIPEDALDALVNRNYVSKWLLARGLFELGNIIRPRSKSDFPDSEAHRRYLRNTIREYRMQQGVGVIAKFDPQTFNSAIWFSKLGDGSMGGKGRGLAFMNRVLQKHDLYDKWEDIRLVIPRTLVVTTEYFDRFIIENGLQFVINSDISDSEILSEFVSSTLPAELTKALKSFIHHVRKPLAVRSSSKLEDSYYQPFAGVYSTYMIPRTENEDQMLRLLAKAIKSVWASVYYAASRSYITATANVISEEKMGIVLQEICGSEDSGYFFPTFSGVARSLNFYPIGYEKPEDGICKVAFGLGKAVVDGDEVLRFCPRYPGHVLQTSTPGLAMKETQKSMFALNLKPEKFKTSIDDSVNLERLSIAQCESFRNMKFVASTWDNDSMRMVDSIFANGPRFITFAHILKYNTFPLAEIIRELLRISKEEMKCNVEIEFAANLDREKGKKLVFNVLQIRPISGDSLQAQIDWDKVDCSNAIIESNSALGTGKIQDVQDIIYLKPSAFDITKTVQMAEQITELNIRMRERKLGYVLIGYGRWGSSIPSLGVPVQWSDISEARVIIESGMEGLAIDPSQGTHFFQNLTSFNVGYIDVNPGVDGGLYDVDKLEAMEAVEETEFLRHVRFEKPLEICIDGLKNRALIK